MWGLQKSFLVDRGKKDLIFLSSATLLFTVAVEIKGNNKPMSIFSCVSQLI